jgi:hypothetical protein
MPGDFGEQVGAAARERLELGYCGGFLLVAQFTPAGMVSRLTVQFGDEEAVSLRALIDHVF